MLSEKETLEPSGSSLSDWSLTGEPLELDGGRLFETPADFGFFSLSSRVSARRFEGPGFKAERMSYRLKWSKPSHGLYVSEKAVSPNVDSRAKKTMPRPTLIKNDCIRRIVSINLLLGSSVLTVPNLTMGIPVKLSSRHRQLRRKMRSRWGRDCKASCLEINETASVIMTRGCLSTGISFLNSSRKDKYSSVQRDSSSGWKELRNWKHLKSCLKQYKD